MKRDDVKRLFVTAFDIAPEWACPHAGSLPALHGQRRVQDNQFSGPGHEETSETPSCLHTAGVKGITIFRSGSKSA
jgi:hypothetical protein